MQMCQKFKVLIIPGEVCFFFVDLKNSITSEANCNIILTARSGRVVSYGSRGLSFGHVKILTISSPCLSEKMTELGLGSFV